MGGSSGGGGSTSTQEIPAELKPLFKQTGQVIQGLQTVRPGAIVPNPLNPLGGLSPFGPPPTFGAGGFTGQPTGGVQGGVGPFIAPQSQVAPLPSSSFSPSYRDARIRSLEAQLEHEIPGAEDTDQYAIRGEQRQALQAELAVLQSQAAAPQAQGGTGSLGGVGTVGGGVLGPGGVPVPVPASIAPSGVSFDPSGNVQIPPQGGLPGSVLDEFLFPTPQIIPQPTGGQLDILGRQRERAFGQISTPQELQAAQIAQTFGQLQGPEAQALTQAGTFGNLRFPEATALNLSNTFGQLRGPEAQALTQAGTFGQLQGPEAQALTQAGTFGAFQTPELAALQQIGQFASGPIGSSPVTQAAMAAARGPVLNDLALAGLGNSGAIGMELGGAYAPILAQEVATRAGIIPQLTSLGQQLRGGAISGAGLQAQIGQALRQGDITGAGLQAQIGQALRQGDISGAGLQAQIGQAQRAGAISGANLQAQIGERLRAGDIAGANFLAQQGQTFDARETQRLADLAQSEEGVRQLQAQQLEAITQDILRRQGLAANLTTGVLSGFPSTLTQQSTKGGGK